MRLFLFKKQLKTIFNMEKNKWISVKTDLPNYWVDVIVCDKYNHVLPAHLTEENEWKQESKDEYRLKNITHWQPLPEPPKQ